MNKIGSIKELALMKKPPDELSFDGDLRLLDMPKISIVGSRKPSRYTKEMVAKLASSLSKRGVCIVSGGAIGVDAMAHKYAQKTIAVLPCGVDLRYPAINKNLLDGVAQNGLLLSQFSDGFKATPWSFVARNEIVVALGEVLVVGEADLNSGSLRSVEFALKMGKEVFVLPHRLGESLGTQGLLKDNLAKSIYDIDEFASRFGASDFYAKSDDFLEYCKSSPTYEDAMKKFGSRVFEAELSGDIVIKDGKVFIV
ncbi:MAG: DNA-processing protein DprA [Sulfurimonas sp.]|jgi:DNA processing protein|nr:DNA-processing protein DprA [Sulfurimonadaceae bacterium]